MHTISLHKVQGVTVSKAFYPPERSGPFYTTTITVTTDTGRVEINLYSAEPMPLEGADSLVFRK